MYGVLWKDLNYQIPASQRIVLYTLVVSDFPLYVSLTY